MNQAEQNARIANEMAHEIAEVHSISIIECSGARITDRIGRLLWYEVDPNDPSDGHDIREALRYLSLRGLLRRDRRFPNRVNVRGAR
jgi:hypothetical protein